VWSKKLNAWFDGEVVEHCIESNVKAEHSLDVHFTANGANKSKLFTRAHYERRSVHVRLRQPAEPERREEPQEMNTDRPEDEPQEEAGLEDPADDEEDEAVNPYWMGLGPEGIRRAVTPPDGFHLARLNVCCDFGPKNAQDIRQILAAMLPGGDEAADQVTIAIQV